MSLFNWRKRQDETSTATKMPARRPQYIDRTESYSVNKALTKGLYHNSFPGLKLAGAMAYTPITVPVQFMGIPVLKTDEEDEEIQKVIKEVTSLYYMKCEQIHTQCHREGTIWIYPHYSVKNERVVWDFISDDTVTDIIKDIETGEIVKLITEEEIKVSTGYDKTATVIRRREFTAEKVTVKYIRTSGYIETVMLDKTMRNVSGVLPINFTNNADGDESRGHSDYERIVPDLKSYHDVEYASLIMLAKFNVKLVQNGKSYEEWKNNLLQANGWSSEDEIDIAAMDLIFNDTEEKTELLWPQGAHQAAEAKLKTLFRKIVEGSGIPEIVWGLKTEGNNATVEESINSLNMYVANKRNQKTAKYKQLFTATLKLWGIANMRNTDYNYKVVWNDLDAVSPEVKSTIFKNYAEGIQKIVDTAAMTKEQLFEIWKKVYPEITQQDYDEFVLGMSDMAAHVQYKSMSYAEGIDFRAGNDESGI